MPPGIPVKYKRLQQLEVWVKKLMVDGQEMNLVAPGNSITVTDVIVSDELTVGGESTFNGDTAINGSLAIDGGLTTTGFVQVGGRFQVEGTQGNTATVDGAGTGALVAGSTLVNVTSDDANKQVSLPAAVEGHRIRIKTGATGCELISQVPGDKVNTVVVGATNELALVANALFDCQYVVGGNWIVTGVTDLGAAIATLVPDAL